MEQNNTRKYLQYALGEVILVMIGILLALQVNNWNENRKDRIKEQRYSRSYTRISARTWRRSRS
jgi:hypothetical protein